MAKAKVTLITPTGDRQTVFKLCEQWMSRQTYSWDQWIVVDDGKVKTIPVMGQDYIRLPFKNKITLNTNLLAAIPKIKYNRILIIEDDDYYAPEYIETMMKWMKGNTFDLVGQGESIYYNIVTRWFTKNSNKKHCSLCQTGFKKSQIKYLKQACEDGPLYIDHRLWEYSKNANKLIETKQKKICIGMKGLPGRKGIAAGHEVRTSNDPNLTKLKELLGKDFKVYESFAISETLSEGSYMVEGFRVRRNVDGTLWLPKSNKKIERILNDKFVRVPNELRWKVESKKPKSILNLANKYKGQGCYLIGKGPSLDEIVRADFSNPWPVICINESIKAIEKLRIPNPIFAIQQDAYLKETCWSKTGTMLLSYICSSWYGKHPNVITYSPMDFGITISKHPLTVIMALYIIKHMGVEQVHLMGFDALREGPLRDCTYAPSIGYGPEGKGDPNRFIRFGKSINTTANELGLKLTIF